MFLDILITLPVVTTTGECSFSQMKIVKTHLRNRLSDISRSVTHILCTSVSIRLLRSLSAAVNVQDPLIG